MTRFVYDGVHPAGIEVAEVARLSDGGAIPAADLPYVITAAATEPTPVPGRLNLWIDTSGL